VSPFARHYITTKTATARFDPSPKRAALSELEKSGREDLNLRPPGPEPGARGLLKREETRGFIRRKKSPGARREGERARRTESVRSALEARRLEIATAKFEER